MTKFVLYGGKGGVGKTTCAAATALDLANDGHETLIVSTDPAHSLSDSLEVDVPSDPEEVFENLWAVEVDPEQAMEEYRSTFMALPEKLQGTSVMGMDIGLGDTAGEMGSSMGGLFDDAMLAPGSDEVAAMLKFMEFMDSDDWDYIVFDTAPTGHTLKLLELPEVLDSMVGRLLRIRGQIQGVVDSVKGLLGGGDDADDGPSTTEQLEDVKSRVERVRAKLRDPEYTEFRVVSIPERMAILETQRLIERLSRVEVPVRTVVINQVMEDVNEDCEFCCARWETQQENLEEAEDMFKDLEIVRLPMQRGEVRGIETLERVGERLEVEV